MTNKIVYVMYPNKDVGLNSTDCLFTVPTEVDVALYNQRYGYEHHVVPYMPIPDGYDVTELATKILKTIRERHVLYGEIMDEDGEIIESIVEVLSGE